jgi:hypothetical protein
VTAGRKLLAFVLGLAVVFAAGYGIGAGVDPVLEEPAPQHEPGHQP